MFRHPRLFLVALIVFVSCQRTPVRLGSGGADEGDSLSSLLDTLNDPQLSAADAAGLKALAKETKGLAPSASLGDLGVEIPDSVSDDPAAQMAILADIVGSCGERVADLAPQPGEPLLGDWALPNRANFTRVSGDYENGAKVGSGSAGDTLPRGKVRLAVEGATHNVWPTRSVSPDGSLSFAYGKYVIEFLDFPTVRPSPSNYGSFAKVALLAEYNPIPDKYEEAVRLLAQCYRTALFVFTPSSRALTQRLGPELTSALFKNLLGANRP